MVICPRCGNNCCNAGYGELEDGSKCDVCPLAYEIQKKAWDDGTAPKFTEEEKGPDPYADWPRATPEEVMELCKQWEDEGILDFSQPDKEETPNVKPV
jgi:hypothetical protein